MVKHMKNIIFYQPIEKSEALHSQSGTSIRPKELKKAFKNNGIRIIDINGNTKKRSLLVNKAQKEKVDYTYVESANIPMILSNKEHWKISVADLKNFYQLSKDMKLGLFYRDAHWRYKNYIKSVGLVKGIILKILYYTEFFFITKIFDYIFIPSEAFKNLLPSYSGKAEYIPLPPAASKDCKNRFKAFDNEFRIIYSGNISNGGTYDLTEVFDILIECKDVQWELEINTPNESWENYHGSKKLENLSNIIISHHTYDDMVHSEFDAKYNLAIIHTSLPKNIEKMAMPIKTFQYIGMGIPIICSGESAYADFIVENDIGWKLDSWEDLPKLLRELSNDNRDISVKHNNMLKIKEMNTWEARVETIDYYLSKNRNV